MTFFFFFFKRITNVAFAVLLQYIIVTRQLIQLAGSILGFCSTKVASVRQEDVFRITLPSGVPHL